MKQFKKHPLNCCILLASIFFLFQSNLLANNCSNPTQITMSNNCTSTLLTAQSTLGETNDANNWSCMGLTTNGEDIVYEIIVPANSTTPDKISVKIDNALDTDDNFLEVIFLGTTCNTSICSSHERFDLINQEFVGQNSKCVDFVIAGPGTYYLILDSENSGASTFDIEFGYTGEVTDQRGVWNLSTCSPFSGNSMDIDFRITPVNVVPLGGVIAPNTRGRFFVKAFLKNNAGLESIKKITFNLGSCWQIIGLPNPTNTNTNDGFYDLSGDWQHNTFTNNSITWEFISSSTNPLGDKDLSASNYACNQYDFSFDAQSNVCGLTGDLSFDVIIEGDGAGTGADIGCCLNCNSGPCYPHADSIVAIKKNITRSYSYIYQAALSVDLLYFNAQAKENGVELNWATSTETENEKFEIQQSLDGINFETIATKTGAGNSNQEIQYQYFDANAQNGKNYYRLKMVDFSGKETFSEIKEVLLTKPYDLKVFPNPVQQNTQIEFSVNEKQNVNLILRDKLGKTVKNILNNKTYSVGTHRIVFDAKDLTEGIYFCTIQLGNVQKTVKVVLLQ